MCLVHGDPASTDSSRCASILSMHISQAKDPNGRSPLMLAASLPGDGDPTLVKALLTRNSKVLEKDMQDQASLLLLEGLVVDRCDACWRGVYFPQAGQSKPLFVGVASSLALLQSCDPTVMHLLSVPLQGARELAMEAAPYSAVIKILKDAEFKAVQKRIVELARDGDVQKLKEFMQERGPDSDLLPGCSVDAVSGSAKRTALMAAARAGQARRQAAYSHTTTTRHAVVIFHRPSHSHM